MPRRLVTCFLIMAMILVPVAASAQTQDDRAPTAQSTRTEQWLYPLVLGAGAIAGVVAYTVATTGVFFRPALPGARVSFGDLANSRVYTVSAAVVGGWIANWLYSGQEYRKP